MSRGFEGKDWPPARGTVAAMEDGDAPSDWRGLHARLAAAYAFRRERAAAALQPCPATGSFDVVTARTLAAYGGNEPDVNPTDLLDGKGLEGNGGGVAGAPRPGDRG